MRINNNLMALNTHRQYAINNSNTANSVEKLSSGLRINRAGDDAAGLAISEKMRAQIRGLNMASKNSQDAISLVQTAEGALAETASILQRMRELSVQSSSDTNDDATDRAALDAEYQQMVKEIDDIAVHTAFNGKKLLNGTVGSAATVTPTGLAAGITVSADSTADTGTVNIATVSDWSAGSAVAGTLTMDVVTWDNDIAAVVQTGPIAAGSAYNGTYWILVEGSDMSAMTFSLVDNDGGVIESTGPMSVSPSSDYELDYGDYGAITITLGSGASTFWLTTIAGVDSYFKYTISGGTDAVPNATIGGQPVTQGDTSVTLAQGVTLDISGLDAADWASQDALNTALFGSTSGSASVVVTAGVPGMTIQTGANAGDTMSIQLGDMTAAGLNVNGTDINTRNSASQTITAVNDAINAVSTQRAQLGAIQNRLVHKINNLNTTGENLSAAESRIRDVDMAQEMTDYTKNNILVQAAMAMLAQANQAPQAVLQLLQ
ncbi:MAG: flagellin [Bacillota bacterium]